MFVIDDVEGDSPFEFSLDGRAHSIPRRGDLPLPKLRKLQSLIGEKAGEYDIVYAMLDVFEDYAPGISDSLTLTQAAALVKAYATDGNGEPMGESSPSSE